MHFLIAPDKFKDSLSAREAAIAIGKGIKDINPSAICEIMPMADGGEGTLLCIESHLNIERIVINVFDPLYRQVEAFYLWDANTGTAYIEMAQASGLQLLDKYERDPMDTTSYGTGELIKDAAKRGANSIFLFVGGSATSDGGMGMAQALGFRFYDKHGEELEGTGSSMWAIQKIDSKFVFPEIKSCRFTICTDVINPLYGPNGAVYQYALQKGAYPEDFEILEEGLINLSQLIKTQNIQFTPETSGLGAAGGIGIILFGYLNASILPAAAFIFETVQFEKRVIQADYVITGEGKYDQQTLQGKLVEQVLRIAKVHQKTTYIICGDTDLVQDGSENIYSITSMTDSLHEAIYEAPRFVRSLAVQIVRNIIHKAN